MNNYIKFIIQNDGKVKRKINLNGKNLILVGNNGSGKTHFLKKLQSDIASLFINQDYQTTSELKEKIDQYRSELENTNLQAEHYNGIVRTQKHFEILLERKHGIDIILNSNQKILKEIVDGQMFFRFFEAGRAFASHDANQLTSIDTLFNNFKNTGFNSEPTSNFFESYLVSMSNYALLEKGAGEIKEYERVMGVINKIQSDLRSLFEGEGLILFFNRKRLRMEIIQENKEPFGLDQLPSGFASILAIYAELIMLSELNRKDKGEIKGIVIIDEIDAHLHVTLQKKVFNFFSESFPEIQFLISTHSPFVVQSVSNAVIYNLSSNKQTEDLSIYSYTSIVKGLLDESTSSNELEVMLSELYKLSKHNNYNNRFEKLVRILEENIDVLDPKAKAILLGAKSKFIDWKEEQDNV